MGYINTGIKRSLTFQVIKEVNGVIVTGYPITYNGQQAFTFNSVVYPLLSSPAFAIMSDADYTTRLNAFKAYVATLEPGIDFTADIVAGFEPTKTDLADCPPPVEVSTTTTTSGTTTTTTTLARRIINISVSYGGLVGNDNGISGEASVCGIMFNLPVYTNQQVISTTGLASQACMVDLSVIKMYRNALENASYIYFRNIGETIWNDVTESKYFVIPTNGTTTVNIEVNITDTPMEMTCQYFALEKTDWEDNQRALFDVILCDGTPTTLEILDGQVMMVCLNAAIPVNSNDTATAVMDCTDGDICHNMYLTKEVDDSELGTFNCKTCNGVNITLNVKYGNPLTVCLNSATPIDSNDTAVILGTCPDIIPPNQTCFQINEQLGWSAYSALDACSQTRDTYYGNNASFALSTTISAGIQCGVTLGGYYSNGTIWKYTPDGINFTANGNCTPVTTQAPQYWYRLYRCDDYQTYYVGPFTGTKLFNTGDKVQGTTNVFYRVTGTVNTDPGATIAGITLYTGGLGC